MDIRIDFLKEINICPYCLGRGKLKAMQSVATSNATSIRGRDKEVNCRHCDGKGLVK